MRLFFAPPDTTIPGRFTVIGDAATRSGHQRYLVISHATVAPAGCYDLGDPRRDLGRQLSNPEANAVETELGLPSRSMRGATIRDALLAAYPQLERCELFGLLILDRQSTPKAG